MGCDSWFRAGGLEFRVQGSGLRVQREGCTVQGLGFRVEGLKNREYLGAPVEEEPGAGIAANHPPHPFHHHPAPTQKQIQID